MTVKKKEPVMVVFEAINPKESGIGLIIGQKIDLTHLYSNPNYQYRGTLNQFEKFLRRFCKYGNVIPFIARKGDFDDK